MKTVERFDETASTPRMIANFMNAGRGHGSRSKKA